MSGAVKCKLLLYADDSALLVSGSDVSLIQRKLSQELSVVQEWLVDNKLSLHLGKTESILFASKSKLRINNCVQVECGGVGIESKQNVTYLGITLDQSLSGEPTANAVINKSNNKLKFLYRKARNLDQHTKKLLVSALIQCHFDYACASWYTGLTKKSKNRLQVVQNKTIRFILNLPPRSHIGIDEFVQVGFLPVQSRVNQLQLNLMYNIFNNCAPSYLMSSVQLNTNTRTRYNQSSFNAIRLSSFGVNSFSHTGVKLWNDLPIQVKLSQSKYNFKKGVKEHFLSRLRQDTENSFYYY